jgi:Nucleotidyl transferase AbiEii toxin, Type IV TA system
MISRAEVGEIAVEASRLSKIPARYFEKDYYVTQALRAIFAEMSDHVVFKGGTSLSKAYRLINRFSEDIDLLIDPPEGKDNPAGIDAILNRIVEVSMVGIGGTVTVKDDKREPGLARKTNLRPDYNSAKQSGISSDIQIESGRRGGPVPVESQQIAPMAASYMDLEGEDFEKFDVVVLHPARTLLEKLLAVKALGDRLVARSDEKVPSRVARHFYDIHALLADDSPAVKYLRGSPGSATELLRDCEAVTARWYDEEPSFVGSLAQAAVFVDADIQGLLRQAYERTCGELCYPGTDIPTWNEVLDRVRLSEDLLLIE